jgi:hypothetical protein
MAESPSLCLVDAAVLVEAVRRGSLTEMCRRRRLGTGELTIASSRLQRTGIVVAWAADLATFVADGRIEVLSANAVELAEVVRWGGSWTMCGAELELLALGLAGKGRLCTADAVVRRAMRELGFEDRWVSAAGLFGESQRAVRQTDGR